MDIFIQQIINGLVLGSMYALIALGYTMVYGPQTTGAISYGYFFTKEWRVNINYGTGFRAW